VWMMFLAIRSSKQLENLLNEYGFTNEDIESLKAKSVIADV